MEEPIGEGVPWTGTVEAGPGLCLSGGGYRAMLFHLGTLWRLYEANLLGQITRFSSVSGGSITAATLALAWSELSFVPDKIQDDFVPLVVGPVRALADRTLDRKAIIGGIFLPGTIGEHIAAAYDEILFKGATLQDLPQSPRFVINATSVQSGALWRFSRPYMADWRVGRVEKPTLRLALAVAASSAFPPVLSPLTIDLSGFNVAPVGGEDLCRPPFTQKAVLTDGGVYDNLGLETIWRRMKTVFVSDGGGRMKPDDDPHEDWARHSYRVLDLIDNQVRNLRMRQIVGSFAEGTRQGAFWSIRNEFSDYTCRADLPCPAAHTAELAAVPTRLKALNATTQERLINWGYAVCDAALRTYFDSKLAQPKGFPYATSGV